MAAKEAHVVAAEAGVLGPVGADLVDHVPAVEDHHSALRVGDPAAFVGERALGRGVGARREDAAAPTTARCERAAASAFQGAACSARVDIASRLALARPRTTVTSRASNSASWRWARFGVGLGDADRAGLFAEAVEVVLVAVVELAVEALLLGEARLRVVADRGADVAHHGRRFAPGFGGAASRRARARRRRTAGSSS